MQCHQHECCIHISQCRFLGRQWRTAGQAGSHKQAPPALRHKAHSSERAEAVGDKGAHSTNSSYTLIKQLAVCAIPQITGKKFHRVWARARRVSWGSCPNAIAPTKPCMRECFGATLYHFFFFATTSSCAQHRTSQSNTTECR